MRVDMMALPQKSIADDWVYTRNRPELLANWRQRITLALRFSLFRIRKPTPVRPRINRTNPKLSTAPPITVMKQIGGAKLFSRYVLPRPGDEVNRANPVGSGEVSQERTLEYGAEYRNAVQYAPTPEEAIRGLKRQLANRSSQDDEVLTLQSGIEAGLDEDCIRQFCTDNELDPASSITRRDLRKLVLQRRALNCAQYRVGLGKVKISMSCR